MNRNEFILMEEYSFGPPSNPKILPSGSFVRPIEARYVPNHCKESYDGSWFSAERDVWCYTRYGVIPIPRVYIRGLPK